MADENLPIYCPSNIRLRKDDAAQSGTAICDQERWLSLTSLTLTFNIRAHGFASAFIERYISIIRRTRGDVSGRTLEETVAIFVPAVDGAHPVRRRRLIAETGKTRNSRRIDGRVGCVHVPNKPVSAQNPPGLPPLCHCDLAASSTMDNDAISGALSVPSCPCTTRNPLVPMRKYRPDSGSIDTSALRSPYSSY